MGQCAYQQNDLQNENKAASCTANNFGRYLKWLLSFCAFQIERFLDNALSQFHRIEKSLFYFSMLLSQWWNCSIVLLDRWFLSVPVLCISVKKWWCFSKFSNCCFFLSSKVYLAHTEYLPHSLFKSFLFNVDFFRVSWNF